MVCTHASITGSKHICVRWDRNNLMGNHKRSSPGSLSAGLTLHLTGALSIVSCRTLGNMPLQAQYSP